MIVDFADWAADRRSRFDAFLADRYADTWPPALAAPLAYPVFGGGKRFRPLACIAAYEAVAPGADLAPVLPAAAAVELIHTYSLVHDDLPCMDDDAERRGRPTVHVRWDEGTALLVGDALLTDAFAVLADAPLAPAAVVACVRELARAAGHRGMVGGQAADTGMDGPITDQAALTRMHRLKTGALIAASATLGGIAAGADATAQRALTTWGEAVGLAFQLADDVLDAEEDAGDDGPPSFVKLLGRDETGRLARRWADDAASAVSVLADPRRLNELARFTVERDV